MNTIQKQTSFKPASREVIRIPTARDGSPTKQAAPARTRKNALSVFGEFIYGAVMVFLLWAVVTTGSHLVIYGMDPGPGGVFQVMGCVLAFLALVIMAGVATTIKNT